MEDLSNPTIHGEEYLSGSLARRYETILDRIFEATFNLEVWNFSFRMFWSADFYNLQEAVRRNCNNPSFSFECGPDEFMARVLPMHQRDTNIKHIVLAFKWEWKGDDPKQFSLLQHEVSHAIFTFFKHKNIPLPKDGDWENNDEEPFCYYGQWLYEKCLDALIHQGDDKFNYDFAELKRIN